MLTNKEINYIEGLIDRFVHKDKYKEDLTQEIFLILCELGEEKLEKLRVEKKLYNYVYGIFRNQYLSGTSSFYRTYKKWDIDRQEIKEVHYEQED